LADGKNGLRVVQMTSPDVPATWASREAAAGADRDVQDPEGGKAHAVSRGLDRDRAVDEGGNQIAVFGRVGARPLNLAEQRKMYLRGGALWRVSDDPFDAMYLRQDGPRELPASCRASASGARGLDAGAEARKT